MRTWILPEYIEDILPAEAARIERLRRDILDLFVVHGFELVMPPMIEHLESLLTGTGHDLDLQTFKLVDQLSGRMLGVRPEHIELVAQGGVPGSVTSAEYHGADSVLTVRVGEESLLVRAPGRVGLGEGAAVRLGWRADAMHLFDAASGARIDMDQRVPQPA